MSEIQPVAFSPIENKNRISSPDFIAHTLEEFGFTVVRFPRYDGDPDRNVELSEEILARAGGLLIDRLGADFEPEQDAAIFDRVRVATQMKKPVFVQGMSRKALILEDIKFYEEYHSAETLSSAAGFSVRTIFEEADIVETSPREEAGPYESMRRRLSA